MHTSARGAVDAEVARVAEVATADVYEARELVAATYCPHRLEPLAPRRFRCRFARRSLATTGISRLGYGAGVHIEPGDLDWFYAVQLPSAGTAHVRAGRDEVQAGPGLGTVVSPGAEVSMQWGEGARHLMFHVARSTMEEHLVRLLGRRPKAAVRFEVGMDLTAPAGRSFARALAAVETTVSAEDFPADDDRVSRAWEQALVTQLLLQQPHNFSDELNGEGPVTSAIVRRAMTLIEHHCLEPLTTVDIAEAVGCSVRGLQDGFRHQLSTTPMGHLRDARLEVAHRLLETGTPETTSVTEVGVACHLFHLGRFATTYRDRFGEYPSETLAR